MINSSFFPRGTIPYLPNTNYYTTDTCSYPSIRDTVLKLENQCIDDESPHHQYGGWTSVGSRGSIGVFLWSTMSSMNRMVGRAVNQRSNLAEMVVGRLNITDVETQ